MQAITTSITIAEESGAKLAVAQYKRDLAGNDVADGDLLALRASNAATNWYGQGFHQVKTLFTAGYVTAYLEAKNAV